MKQELIDFTTLVKDMRRAQKAYFAARKKQDYQQSKRFLEESKKLEGQVDKWLSERRDKAIYGEESRLFK